MLRTRGVTGRLHRGAQHSARPDRPTPPVPPWRNEWKASSVPRRTWLDDKADVLLEELSASGMHLDRQHAAELITERVRAVAAAMSVTEPTARRYLDDETLRDMARRMLFEFVDEQPGANLMRVPRTVAMSLILVGTTIAALAEAMQIRAAHERAADRLGPRRRHLRADVVRARADHRPGRVRPGEQVASDHVSAGVVAPCRQVHQQRRRPGGKGWRTSRRSSRDSTPCTRRSPTPRRRRSDRAHHHGLRGSAVLDPAAIGAPTGVSLVPTLRLMTASRVLGPCELGPRCRHRLGGERPPHGSAYRHEVQEVHRLATECISMWEGPVRMAR